MKRLTALTLCLPAFATGVFLLSATGQEKPVDPVKPSAETTPASSKDAEQSVRNLLKQDERNKAKLQEAIDKLKELARKNEATDAELRRLDPKTVKDEDPEKLVESLKGKLSEDDLKTVKEGVEALKDSVAPEAARMAREIKEKALQNKGTTKITPSSSAPRRTFDKVPAPTPLDAGPQRRAELPGLLINAEEIIYPMAKDPADPDRALPASDVRTRTWHAAGVAKLRTPSFAIDGDVLDWIVDPAADGGGLSGSPGGKSKIDPVQPGRANDGSADMPIERAVATGRVVFVRIDNTGSTVTGRGGRMVLDKKSGTVVLTGWPELIQGNRRIFSNSKDSQIIIPLAGGNARTIDCRTEVINVKNKTSQASPAAPASPR